MIENIRVALMGLSSNRLRSSLTMLGITIGVAAVILLISLGQAVQSYILGQFSGIGTNLVFVFGTLDERNRPQPLTQTDVNVLSDIYRVPDAAQVVGAFDISRNYESEVVFEGLKSTNRVTGVTPDYIKVVNRTITDGRFFDAAELATGARVAVIGVDTIDRLFKNVNPVGQNVRIAGVRFQVIGVLNKVGGASGFAPGGGVDSQILIPLTTAQLRMSGDRALSGERPVSAILIKARDETSVQAVVEEIKQTLREEHRIGFGEDDDFQVATQEDLLNSLGSITGLLTVFLGIIAGISLLVGGIGIMNIMLVTVTERTREIGLRKAVGAQKPAILFQFLTEATVLALIGGAVGIGIAWGLAAAITSVVPDLTVSIQVSSVTLATLISVAIGVFFGIYPANRAASLNPIDALRYE